MARQAQQIHVADLQHVHIGRSMRCVAGLATFDLYRLMFKNKRPSLVGMTIKTDRVLCRRSPQLVCLDRAMRIMTIAARYQAFVHPVVEGHCKLRLLLRVTGVAEVRLRLNEQKLGYLGVMGGMAIQAAHIVVAVDGSREIHLLLAGFVAGHTTIVHHLGGGSLETEYLGRVAGIIDMLCSRPMTTLTALV